MAGDTKQPDLITILRHKIGEPDNGSADQWPSRRLDNGERTAHPELPEGGDTLQFSWKRLVYDDDGTIVGLNLDGKLFFLGQKRR